MKKIIEKFLEFRVGDGLFVETVHNGTVHKGTDYYCLLYNSEGELLFATAGNAICPDGLDIVQDACDYLTTDWLETMSISKSWFKRKVREIIKQQKLK